MSKNETVQTGEHWYFVEGKKTVGPLTRLDLISLANGGKVKADSQVYCASFSEEWKSLTDFKVLRECELLPREWFTNLDTNLYYYCDSYGTEKGPVTLEELLFNERTNGGELHSKSLVRSEHSYVWKWLCDVVGSKEETNHSKKNTKRKLSEMNETDDNISDEIEELLKEVSKQEMDASAERIESIPKEKKRKKKSKRKGKIVNKSVYVTGLPMNCTDADITRVFEQCGEIHRVKLYRWKDGPNQGTLKGDGFVTFKRPESVAIAIERLNQTELDSISTDENTHNSNPPILMNVEVAQFNQTPKQAM